MTINQIWQVIATNKVTDLDYDWAFGTATFCRNKVTDVDDSDESHDWLELAEELEDIASLIERHLEKTELDFETEMNAKDRTDDQKYIEEFNQQLDALLQKVNGESRSE